MARNVLETHLANSLIIDRAHVTVQLVDGAVRGESLKGSCAVAVTGRIPDKCRLHYHSIFVSTQQN